MVWPPLTKVTFKDFSQVENNLCFCGKENFGMRRVCRFYSQATKLSQAIHQRKTTALILNSSKATFCSQNVLYKSCRTRTAEYTECGIKFWTLERKCF